MRQSRIQIMMLKIKMILFEWRQRKQRKQLKKDGINY